MMVLSLCAIVITVLSANSCSISCYIFCSVTMSILAVASSRITTLFFLRIARQMHSNYFSPALRLAPPSEILKYMPFPYFFLCWRSRLEVFKSFVGYKLETSVLYFTSSSCLLPADSGSRLSRSESPALIRSYSMAALEYSLKGSRLNLIVPENRVGS